ncbi:Curli production assembly/transport component CsgF [Sinobacterium norvegicum]|uniref:Curli production assembly/transport component CsgF n=1 Tax=Sinobacterium norvegicum TaxID=1641715 RepID=A0ABN8EJQ2_9GAMM|nr:curli assembly protein CsgF [Sinobacterium norvegicum]CAH0992676.1 Curli production assembly/transport component CsgF [Sinobacterium norvegicum]
MFIKLFILIFVLLFTGRVFSGQLIYQPVNPSFGGSPINSSYLLDTANAQNKHKDPDAREYEEPSKLERFTTSLEQRLLNDLLNNGEGGTLQTDDFFIEVDDSDGVLEVDIRDRLTGETSEIIVDSLTE